MKTASSDAMEIMVPSKSKKRLRCSVVCLCCQRADQPMDDDGCGICDACLGLPLQTKDYPEGLEFTAASAHLSVTTRHR